MKRILFVDDEPRMLDALRDRLRKQRARWEMVFVTSAPAALAAFEQEPFDVVVSDMRMPVLDGAALLQEVKARWPRTVRIILSGQADLPATIRAMDASHQFLSKPCEANALQARIERACALDLLIPDEPLRSLIGTLDRLPSVPTASQELARAATRPDVTASELAAIISGDPAMAVKVLQLVNSAYFGIAQPMTSIPEAVSYLGVDLLRDLVRSSHAFEVVELTPVEGFTIEAHKHHAVVTARLAQQFVDREHAEEAYAAALVHDIGALVLAQLLPAQFAEIVRTVSATGRPFDVVERALLGVGHDEIGAYVLAMWGLPSVIADAVAGQHRPSASTAPSATLTAVHVADALTDPREVLDTGFVERAGLAPELPRWRAEAARLFAASMDPAPGGGEPA